MNGKVNSVGRPRIRCTGSDLIETYERLGCTWEDVAKIYGISLMTVFRRLKEEGYERKYVKRDYNF